MIVVTAVKIIETVVHFTIGLSARKISAYLRKRDLLVRHMY